MDNKGKRVKFNKYRLPRKLKKRLKKAKKYRSSSCTSLSQVILDNELGFKMTQSNKRLKTYMDIECGTGMPIFPDTIDLLKIINVAH